MRDIKVLCQSIKAQKEDKDFWSPAASFFNMDLTEEEAVSIFKNLESFRRFSRGIAPLHKGSFLQLIFAKYPNLVNRYIDISLDGASTYDLKKSTLLDIARGVPDFYKIENHNIRCALRLSVIKKYLPSRLQGLGLEKDNADLSFLMNIAVGKFIMAWLLPQNSDEFYNFVNEEVMTTATKLITKKAPLEMLFMMDLEVFNTSYEVNRIFKMRINRYI